jgi:hypothetical protein
MLVFDDNSEKRFCFNRISEENENIHEVISNQLNNVIKVTSEDNENNNYESLMRIKYEELCVLKSTHSMQSVEGNIKYIICFIFNINKNRIRFLLT